MPIPEMPTVEDEFSDTALAKVECELMRAAERYKLQTEPLRLQLRALRERIITLDGENKAQGLLRGLK